MERKILHRCFIVTVHLGIHDIRSPGTVTVEISANEKHRCYDDGNDHAYFAGVLL